MYQYNLFRHNIADRMGPPVQVFPIIIIIFEILAYRSLYSGIDAVILQNIIKHNDSILYQLPLTILIFTQKHQPKTAEHKKESQNGQVSEYNSSSHWIQTRDSDGH